ncbi:MAG TPA: tRNA preQ1(34) S-adenosylmethionine ribosyltransferase-isomerase QueA [Sedimentisphaerales bacterium]|nr:tRNA preQ1(34) S-adenosylmethionine ribosyltransferase-isomerase QueA [Sedimentisphaerales bacterium]
MRTEKLNYDLPPELIAQKPLPSRSDSRLLVLSRSNGEILDSRFNRLGDFLRPGDCLVLNDTKVVPARFFAQRPTGGKLEGLFLSEDADCVWTAYLKGARKLKPGDEFYLKDKDRADCCKAVLLEKTGEGKCRLKLEAGIDARSILEKVGFPPLPPYIKRNDDPAVAAQDKLRYQTVYAASPGAVAAPTAGLHFTEALIEQLKSSGIHLAYITLHVGAGTFKPIAAENIEDHQIHAEWFSIDEENAHIINTAREQGGRIIPVGTTSTRVLETVAYGRQIKPAAGMTELFITPGCEFKMTDALITNFHLPKSSLLALVAAFAGLDEILAAYRHAIEQRYRFYSYGDAMLIV